MQPNILYFIVHDLGRHLGCYGQRTVESPNLDALAAQGVTFTNYFAASIACSPSRGCIMTGRHAHSNGLIGLAHRGWDIGAEERTIVNELNDAGYHTAQVGFQHERRDREANGYAQLSPDHGRESNFAETVAADVCNFLRSEAKDKQPFYLNAGTFEVHLPFKRDVYEPADPDDVEVPPFLVDNANVRAELGRFHGSIKHMDKAVGEILRTLDETGLADNTVVIFTTDHGMDFPRAKATLFDPGVETALIVRAPGATLNGPCDALLSNVDLTPTLLDMIGRQVPERIQGRSFWPLLDGRGETHDPRTEIFGEKNYHVHYDPMRYVRTERHKYIRSFKDGEPALALSGDFLHNHSTAWTELPPGATDPRAPEELYDLIEDPWEQHNLADSPEHAAILDDMRARLDRWMHETGDFLLTDEVPTPSP